MLSGGNARNLCGIGFKLKALRVAVNREVMMDRTVCSARPETNRFLTRSIARPGFLMLSCGRSF